MKALGCAGDRLPDRLPDPACHCKAYAPPYLS